MICKINVGFVRGGKPKVTAVNPHMEKQKSGCDKTGLSLAVSKRDREFSNQQEAATLRQIPGNTTGEESTGAAQCASLAG